MGITKIKLIINYVFHYTIKFVNIRFICTNYLYYFFIFFLILLSPNINQ